MGGRGEVGWPGAELPGPSSEGVAQANPGGVSPSCDDGNVCTLDVCDAQSDACVNTVQVGQS